MSGKESGAWTCVESVCFTIGSAQSEERLKCHNQQSRREEYTLKGLIFLDFESALTTATMQGMHYFCFLSFPIASYLALCELFLSYRIVSYRIV